MAPPGGTKGNAHRRSLSPSLLSPLGVLGCQGLPPGKLRLRNRNREGARWSGGSRAGKGVVRGQQDRAGGGAGPGGLWEQAQGWLAGCAMPFPGIEASFRAGPLGSNKLLCWELYKIQLGETIGASYRPPGKPVPWFCSDNPRLSEQASHSEFSQLREQLASPEVNSCIVTPHSPGVL